MRTVRISDLRRGHPRVEFVPKLRVESFHRSDSEGCTIVTMERHSPDRFSTGPLYMCAPRARPLPPPESSCCIKPIIVCLLHQEPPRLGSRLKFWRTTGLELGIYPSGLYRFCPLSFPRLFRLLRREEVCPNEMANLAQRHLGGPAVGD